MIQPENHSHPYQKIFNDIDGGIIKVPQFQRDFVWDKKQTAKLIDSIIKGFPIGTFIFWRTAEELRHIRNIGNATLPKTPKGDKVFYVLDGQQRITSLYAVRKGLRIDKDGKEIDYKDICINLELEPDADEEVVLTEPPEATHISVCDLLTLGMSEMFDRFERKYIERIDDYRKKLENYSFSTIVIDSYPIDIACEVFTRINTGGKELSLFEIMVAKTFDQEKNFDLSAKYESLIDNKDKDGERDLEDAKYETIQAITVLQCISAFLRDQVRRQDILKLKKNEFVDNWDKVKDGIFSAVDFLRSHLRIKVSRLLPYSTILVPFTYFFIHNKCNKPTSSQAKLLTQYFFWACVGKRFSSGVEAKMAADLKRMHDILNETEPDYNKGEVKVPLPDLEDLKWEGFSASNAFSKTILCLYCFFEPKSFDSGGDVNLDNSWLKQSNSKNYHHFFPKSYLRKKGEDDWYANSILNITIVDDHLNKRDIGTKPPGQYMKKYRKSNENFDSTMKSHLIDSVDDFGIWDNNYETFLEKRGKKVLRELRKRLPKMQADEADPNNDLTLGNDSIDTSTDELKGTIEALGPAIEEMKAGKGEPWDVVLAELESKKLKTHN